MTISHRDLFKNVAVTVLFLGPDSEIFPPGVRSYYYTDKLESDNWLIRVKMDNSLKENEWDIYIFEHCTVEIHPVLGISWQRGK